MCYDVAIMVARTQVALDPELHQRARERAAQLGVSFAEYVRRLVQKDLGSPQQQVSPSIVFRLGSSGGTDVAAEKDRLLGQAIASEHEAERDPR